MARRLRLIADNGIYHVINRRVGRLKLFSKASDFAAFEKVLAEALARTPSVKLLAHILMGNHWHLVVQPRRGKDLAPFMHWLTMTHMRRWHAHRRSAGEGPVYQGRFKGFPVQDDRHFLIVARYVERNALRVGLVKRAEDWRWSSLWHRQQPQLPDWLSGAEHWPVACRSDHLAWVNEPQTEKELQALRRSVNRGAPFGSDKWIDATAKALKLESSLRDPWRPKKETKSGAPSSRKSTCPALSRPSETLDFPA